MQILPTLHHPPISSVSCAALGLFDGMHPGHCAVIQAMVACARGQAASAAVFTFSMMGDQPERKSKAPRLITSDMRNCILGQLGVDYVLSPPFEEFRDMCPAEYVRVILHNTLRASHVFCGENYHFGSKASGDVEDLARLCKEYGISVTVIPMVDQDGAPVSSTRIRKAIAAGDMLSAARLLGRPFTIDFEVMHGRQLGQTLHFPTINQPFPDRFIQPAFGVYATIATVDGQRYRSVSNVGLKPTVGSDRVLAETYILNYQGDLYGRHVQVEFLQFLRPERRFADMDALRAQIAADVEAVHQISSPIMQQKV